MSGMSPYTAFAFSIMTMGIGVPSAIKTFNWLGTIMHGGFRFSSPMLFAIGFVSLFVSGGISGPFLAQPVLDIPLHDTYFVPGHFPPDHGRCLHLRHFAATYYWFPKMFGRMMNESMARWHFWFSLIGTYAIFMPMHYLGYGRDAPALFADDRGGVSSRPDSAAEVHHHSGVHHHRRPADFPCESFLEHVQGTEGQR